MYLKELTISIVTTGVATNEDYSADIGNGLIYAVEYTPGTLPSTAACTLSREGASTHVDGQFLTSISASTDQLFFWPRHHVEDSTNAQIGATTDYPVAYYYLPNERVKVSTVGATSEGGTATWTVYLQGA